MNAEKPDITTLRPLRAELTPSPCKAGICNGNLAAAMMAATTHEELAHIYVHTASREQKLKAALKRISDHEHRADRRHRGMVDVSEVDTLKRIAREALR